MSDNRTEPLFSLTEVNDNTQSSTTVQNDEKYDIDTNPKRQRLSEEDRLQRCRDRNRVHAKNTRERKKVQMEIIQMRIERLHEEKAKLSRQVLDTTVAGILISLSSQSTPVDTTAVDTSFLEKGTSSVTATFDQIKNQVADEMSDLEMADDDMESLKKDKAHYTPEEVDAIRRERNRIHAKKTRMRKKKMMKEIEETVSNLEEEVRVLRCRAESSTQYKMNALAGVAGDSRGLTLLAGSDGASTGSYGPYVTTPSVAATYAQLSNNISVFPPKTEVLAESYPISIPYNMIMYSNGFRPSIIHSSQLMPHVITFPEHITDTAVKAWHPYSIQSGELPKVSQQSMSEMQSNISSTPDSSGEISVKNNPMISTFTTETSMSSVKENHTMDKTFLKSEFIGYDNQSI